MIAVDWGTSNFRASRLGLDGKVLESRSSPMGVLCVADGGFAGVLRDQVGDWLNAGESIVLLCGMVGSRFGWHEAAYAECPAGMDDLARAMLKVPFQGAQVWIVPGVEAEAENGVPEVMRGEETAVLGSMESMGGNGLICLPGTHSKWVSVRDFHMTGFLTCMTGEVFAALRQHTILSQFIHGEEIDDLDAFHLGVHHSGERGGLLHQLFRVRTLALKSELPETSSSAFLSGLLIGSEVRAMLPEERSVVLAGAPALCRLYAEAIARCGGHADILDFEVAARGLWLLAQRVDRKQTENREQ